MVKVGIALLGLLKMCRKKVLASQKIAKNSTINLAKKSSETILKYMKQCPYKSIFPKKNLNKVQWVKNQEKWKKNIAKKSAPT